jgi:hypothetical protein
VYGPYVSLLIHPETGLPLVVPAGVGPTGTPPPTRGRV